MSTTSAGAAQQSQLVDPVIRCPHCQRAVKLTDAVAGPMMQTAREQFARDIEQAKLAAASEARHDAINEASAQSIRLQADLQKATRELQVRDSQLKIAQDAQAAAVAKERELVNRERELNLTIERRVTEREGVLRVEIDRRIDSEYQLKLTEKDEQMRSLTVQIEDLKRRATQGSQQLQGEAQELQLEAMLTSAFPTDTITPVAKGVFGGDCLQTVVDSTGKVCGSILWESKRTKTWSDGWLEKLRGDQRAAKADMAVIVTQTLPRDQAGAASQFEFGVMDLVHVTHWKHTIGIAVLLRLSLLEVARTRDVNDGVETKSKLIYRYLTGSRFKQRIQAVLEQSAKLNENLDRERRALTKLWSEREGAIRGILESTAGMYGDLQGIAGKGLAELEGLSLPEA